MAIVAGFDVHRAQITFDALDTPIGSDRGGSLTGVSSCSTHPWWANQERYRPRRRRQMGGPSVSPSGASRFFWPR
jgi:hypothetical protein